MSRGENDAGLFERIAYFCRLHLLRDPLLVNTSRWVRDRGDERLRLEYDLDPSSVVLDLGGYLGDYACAVSRKFGCRVYLFEPMPEFYRHCLARFSDTPAVTCLGYAVSGASGRSSLTVDGYGSSLLKDTGGRRQSVEVRGIGEIAEELGLERIDLLKLNIEGAEFDLLESLIDSGLIERVGYLQVQFHRFAPGAVKRRRAIREALAATHREMWNYDFVWESWSSLKMGRRGQSGGC